MPHSEVPPQAAESERDIVDALLTASRLLIAIAVRSLSAVEHTLTLPQYRMLVVLDSHGPSSLARLAENLQVNPSTALRMVERLTAAGMVEKAAHPESRREVRLHLTPAGRHVVALVTDARRTEIARIVNAMPPDRREDLVAALRAFATAGGEPPADVPSLSGWG